MADAPPPRPDRTVLRPRPGARGAGAGSDPFADFPGKDFPDVFAQNPGRAQQARVPPGAPAGWGGQYDGGDPELPVSWAADDNPLIEAAHPILTIITQLRGSAHHPDPAGLREELARAISRFEQTATKAGATREAVIGARYLLCTFLDETAASTPWGGHGAWASDTLLVRFHNETWGGEKSFLLLSRLSESPDKNHHLLALFHLCLSLGFEGRYRILPNGRAQLEQLRERLFHMIRQGRPAPELDLAVQWAPTRVARRRWFSAAPFWAFCVLAGAAAIFSYLFYSAALASRSDDAFAAVAALRLGDPPKPVAAAVAPAARPRLATLLADEARQGLLNVSDTATRSIVVLKGDLSFDAGSAEVSARMRPVLDKIGRALGAMPGSVLISGHTDSIPIRTARFPSNWHLSRDRANAVMSYLARAVPPSRMQAEGRADTETIASNETPQGRADNRRVQINLFVTQ
ncbi:MAG: type VI secretion system protein TssL, long form [Lautropia sp.]